MCSINTPAYALFMRTSSIHSCDLTCLILCSWVWLGLLHLASKNEDFYRPSIFMERLGPFTPLVGLDTVAWILLIEWLCKIGKH